MNFSLIVGVVVVVLIGSIALVKTSPAILEGKRLIQLQEFESPKWVTLAEIDELSLKNVNFMDITDQPAPPQIRHAQHVLAYPDQVRYQQEVQRAITHLSIPRMTEFIAAFSSFHTRYYTSATGVESSQWLLAQVNAIIAASNYSGQVSTATFSHSWAQDSVIARIEGSDPSLRSEIIVLGAHQDSVNRNSPASGRSPGADDDASGCITLLESLLAILRSGIVPRRSIEWQWYAAEEVGLRGSQDIANAYNAQGKAVVAMANFDVVGYFTGRREFGIVTDYTDGPLNQFSRILVEAYLSFVWTNDVCGYACSDHASWYRAGYPAMYASEIVIHPDMHTTGDTIDTVNFEQVLEFVKFAVGFVIELAEPVDA